MKVKKSFYLILVLAVIAAAVCACGKIPSDDCISYRADSFTLDGRLECGDLQYTLKLAYEKDGPLTATVTAPERIAGCAVTLNADGYAALTFGGITVTLAEADSSLLDFGVLAALRDLVLPPAEGLVSVKVTRLGGQTYNLAVFSGERGNVSVWFDCDGIPVRFEADGITLSVSSFSKLSGEETTGDAGDTGDTGDSPGG